MSENQTQVKIFDHIWNKYYKPNMEITNENSPYFGHRPSKADVKFALEGFILSYKKHGGFTHCNIDDENPNIFNKTAYWVMKMMRGLLIPMEYIGSADSYLFENCNAYKFEREIVELLGQS